MLRTIPIKISVIWILVILLCLSAVLVIRSATSAHAATDVTISTQDMLTYPWLGFGAQYGNIETSLTDSQWNTLTSREDYMQSGLARTTDDFNMCTSPTCTSYDWNAPAMQSWYRMLDSLKSTNTIVVIGTWRVPAGVDFASPQFAKIQGDFLNEMINVKGYTNIKYYHTPNEADCNYSGQTWTNNTLSQWETAVDNLYTVLSSDNLSNKVSIAGPDSCGDSWNSQAPADEQAHLGAYEWHHYDANVSNGNEEPYLSKQLQTIDKNGVKPVFLGEIGAGDPDSGGGGDTYKYGLDMADYAIQIARAGLSGASAWCFDDNLFGSKQCGLGDAKTGSLKPWFYSWSLMARYFRPGSIIYAPTINTTGLRVVAAETAIATGTDLEWTIAAVNQNSSAETLSINSDTVGSAKFDQYNYIDGARTTDSNGFPTPATTVSTTQGNDLSVTVPGNSMVLLTTLPSSGALSTPATGAILPTNTGSPTTGSDTSPTATTSPDASPTITPGSDASPTVTSGSNASPTVTSGSDASPTATSTPDPQTTIVDNLNDWSKTMSHSQNLVLDTTHDSWFENDTSRVKRYSNQTLNFIYHYQNLTNFQAQVYLNDPNEINSFFVDTSSDGTHWIPLTVQNTVPEQIFNQAIDTSGTKDISNIYATTYSAANRLPAGTQYIRVNIGNDPLMWAPQVGDITLSLAR